MTGYVRTDTTNNIADGNVISAADLDNEFNGVQAAFNSSTGHTHDGSSAEGAPITKLGPVQDVTVSTTVLGVKTTNTVDLGTSSLKFKDFYLAGAASIGGTLGVTGATTLSAALTYGGVTLSNAVTGTGNMVLSASPTLTGTITAAAANFSGAVALNGNATIGDADTDTITQAASYVTGTQLKSAKTATNTLSLAAYDVDGTAYTNLITLTAGNTPTLALTSTGVGTINNMSIGATTASTGAFTTLSATGDLSAVNDLTLTNSAASYGNSNNFILFKNSSAATVGGITHPAVTTLGLWGNTGVKIFNGSTAATTIADFTSTGLAVTGTLSTTGNITNSNSAGRLDFTGASSAQVWATASSLYLDAAIGQSVIIRPNNQVTAGTFSSTGLAVTGTFSSTLGATIQGLTVGLGAGAVATNTAVGASALFSNTTNGQNTALGYNAGYYSTGSANTYVGYNAGPTVTASASGSYNTSLGAFALQANTTASNNTAVGYQSLYSNLTGDNNVAVGWKALLSNKTGLANSAVGLAAMSTNESGSYNVAFGQQALGLNTASNNTAVGYTAGYSNNSGTQNVYIGPSSGYYNQTGTENTFVGFSANGNGTGGSAGSYNTAVGRAAMNNSYGSYNTAVGNGALQSNTSASNNTAVGYQAGYTNSTGTRNTFIGEGAGYSTTSSYNTFIGNHAGQSTTGGYNTFIGDYTGYLVTTGAKNVILGKYDGSTAPISGTGSNYIVLADGDGNVRLYLDGSGYPFFPQVRSNAGSYTTKWTTSAELVLDTSSARYKDNIRDSIYGLSHVMQIRSAMFEYKADGRTDVGLVAEELDLIIPELVTKNTENQPDAVSYDRMVSVLIKAIQELKAEVDSLKSQLNGA